MPVYIPISLCIHFEKKKSFKFLSYIGPLGPDQQRSTVVDYLLRGETGKNIVDYQEESELAQS